MAEISAQVSPARPRILYVTPMFGYPPFGGPRLRTYNTLLALARLADVHLHLLRPPDTADPVAARAHMLSFCRTADWPDPPPGPSEPAGMRRYARSLVPPVVRNTLRAVVSRRGSDPAALAAQEAEARARELDEVCAAAHRYSVDVVWLGFGGISYHLLEAKAAVGRPVVLETESVWSRFILRELPFATTRRRREEITREGAAKEAEERLGAARADMTTAVSEADAAYFRDIGTPPEKLMLLANVIDVSSYRADDAAPDPGLTQPAVCFTGTLSRGTANVDAGRWLIDAIMPLIWRVRPDVHLYLVGRDPAPELWQRKSARVHLIPDVDTIRPYLVACRAALVPLRWESGTRFKILEAFACGVPVVSTTLGAEGLSVEHDKHLLLADNAQDFAAAILRLVEHPEHAAQLIQPAAELVEREYDVSSASRQADAILRRVLAGAARPMTSDPQTIAVAT